ncbi:MAG TPA: NAD(P)-dependent oxidoreductase [Pseudolabrys sp.]|nr:NAD(P)-dependent oxidoreductase [Pseudolabrys sp.]
MSPIRKLSFVGVGHMGAPMAARLRARGFDVTVFDARPEVAEAFAAAHGAHVALTLSDVGRGTEALITMLPDHKVVHSVLLGPGGAAASLARGAIVIDMSTSDPRATVTTGEALAGQGITMLDAPVMGGVVFAKDGTLDIMAGGDAAAIDRCMPVFEALGRKVYRCGALGSGHALKALANYVNACTLINVLEAMTVGRKFGLDTAVMTQALEAMCSGRQHPLEKKVIPHVLTRKYGTGMALGLIAKDVGIAVDFAAAIGASAPLAERVRELWAQARDEVGAQVDQTEIVKLWEQASGVKL